MPNRISITLLLTVFIAIVVVFTASEVGAQCDPSGNTADYSVTCGEQTNYTVSIVEPFPEIAECTGFPGENCSTYRWAISPGASHFNLIVEGLFEDKIVDSTGLPLDCTGVGDPSQGADDYAKFLTWNCFIKFLDTGNVSFTVRGEFTSAPTDWFVKQANTSAEGDYGKTRGPAESCEEPETYVTTVDIKKVVQVTNGEEYALCLKAVKVNSKCYNEFYYACPPASGDCNDLGDAAWCLSTAQAFDPRLVTQVYGEWSCSNVIYVPDEAAFMICGGDASPVTTKYPDCLQPESITLSYNGGFANPCSPAPGGYGCVECNFGGYPWCICW